jgi:BlaI family transcriptional regulator, penicillinase repressor
MLTTKQPTDAELEILHLLWELGPSTVRTVNERQNEKREAESVKDPLGYTTTLKLMQIMHEKGWVSRIEDGRTHIYTAAVQETDTQSALLQQFVDNAFRGSAMKMVMQTLGNYEAGAEELDEIKALIAQIEQNQSKP